MKKILKALCVIVLVFSTNTFAQPCSPAPQVYGQPKTCWDGRLHPEYNGIYTPYRQQQESVINNSRQYVSEEELINARVRVVGQQDGGETVTQVRACTANEERNRFIGNEVSGAIVGGLVGVLAKDNRNGAGKGALVGMLISAIYTAGTSCVVTERVRIRTNNVRENGGRLVRCENYGTVTVSECVALQSSKNGGSGNVSGNSVVVKDGQPTIEQRKLFCKKQGKFLVKIINPEHQRKGDLVCASENMRDSKDHAEIM